MCYVGDRVQGNVLICLNEMYSAVERFGACKIFIFLKEVSYGSEATFI